MCIFGPIQGVRIFRPIFRWCVISPLNIGGDIFIVGGDENGVLAEALGIQALDLLSEPLRGILLGLGRRRVKGIDLLLHRIVQGTPENSGLLTATG